MKKLLLVLATVTIAAFSLASFGSSPGRYSSVMSLSKEENQNPYNDVVVFLRAKASKIDVVDNGSGERLLVVDTHNTEGNSSAVLLAGSPVVSVGSVRLQRLDGFLASYFSTRAAFSSSIDVRSRAANRSGGGPIPVDIRQQVREAVRAPGGSELDLPAAVVFGAATGQFLSALPVALTDVQMTSSGNARYVFAISTQKVSAKTLKALSETKNLDVVVSLEADQSAALAGKIKAIKFTSVAFPKIAKK